MNVVSRPSGQARLKVCHLVSSTAGARWMVEQLIGLRDDHGHDVTAVVSGPTGQLIDLLQEAGIPFHVESGFGPYHSISSVMSVPATVWRLARFFRRERFDVVQSHLLFAMLATRFAAWLADTPVRLSMYASPYHLEVWRTLWMDKLSWWMDSCLIASCQYTDDIFVRQGVAPDRHTLIYYAPDNSRYNPATTAPIDLRSAYGWPSATPIVVMIAYFYANQSANDWVPPIIQGKNTKGFADLIRATPLILAEFPNAKVVLVGGGWDAAGDAHLAEMKLLVESLGLSESVRFAGYSAQTNGILRGADVAVQAALYENVGGVMESLMMACPTVATAVGGMVDCVRDGQTGVLVRPADPVDLARGIRSLLRDPAKAKLLAATGRQLMLDRFGLDRTCRDLDELYRARRSANRRRGYNRLVSLLRSVVGVPILFWFVIRVAVRDFYTPVYWPTHRGSKSRSHGIFLSNRLITLKLTLKRYRIEFPLYGRMYKDQLLSWIGNHSPRWGLMQRLVRLRHAISPRSAAAPAEAQPSPGDPAPRGKMESIDTPLTQGQIRLPTAVNFGSNSNAEHVVSGESSTPTADK